MKISIGGQTIGIGGTPLSLNMPRISVVGNEFRLRGQRFKAWGFQNHSHVIFGDAFFASTDMDDEYHVAMADSFRGDRANGANTVRLRLELWTFIEGPNIAGLSVIETAIDNLIFALDAARQNSIYVLLNGCNTTVPETVPPPAWYDALTYTQRWGAHEFFWTEVVTAIVAAGHATTIIGYDLINEPVSSADPDAYWYGPEYLATGYYFIPNIAKGPEVTTAICQNWLILLRDAIKEIDPRALITVGSLAFFGITFGYDIESILDFYSPHLYPPHNLSGGEPASLEFCLALAAGWADLTLPVLVGETYAAIEPGNETRTEETREYLEYLTSFVDGMISFSWGYPPGEFTESPVAPKYPAPDNYVRYLPSPTANMDILKAELELFGEYREDFLA